MHFFVELLGLVLFSVCPVRGSHLKFFPTKKSELTLPRTLRERFSFGRQVVTGHAILSRSGNVAQAKHPEEFKGSCDDIAKTQRRPDGVSSAVYAVNVALLRTVPHAYEAHQAQRTDGPINLECERLPGLTTTTLRGRPTVA